MEPERPGADALAAGRAALNRTAWAEARRQFEEALAAGETPDGLAGLGAAARGQLDGEAAIAAHERGYHLARAEGDESAAARLALELVFDCGEFRGPAEARGWLERAGRLVEGRPPSYEYGLCVYLRATFALNVDHDPATARMLAARVVEGARAAGSVDGEMIALSLEGLALVSSGEVADGMRCLDEATTAAVAGEVEDVRVAETICCHLIDACKRVRDYERAGEWCRRVEEISERFGDADMFATCRTHYADVLVWQGAWSEAEETLVAVCHDLAGVERRVLDGVVRLAELRRRQGRLDEAEALLTQAAGHRLAPLVRAGLALDRDDPLAAAEESDRFLRRIGETDRFERIPALELLVHARLTLGETTAAEQATEELERVAATVGTAPLRAAALLARGRLLAVAEPELARPAFEDAADLYEESGACYEAARARLELAAVLRALGREDAADRADDSGRAMLAALGVPGSRAARAEERELLTRREREVLGLLASGRSNDQIAAELVLSVRTVESHVASIYGKLGLSGRTARVGAAAYAHAHGLA